MGDGNQNLNGAYYGPSIPPPKKSSRRYTPRGGCCCFTCIGKCIGSCLKCCGCCILSVIFNILIVIAVILGISGFIFWLIFRPNVVKFYVAKADLNQFNLDLNNNIHYNLDLNFTIRNPNQRVGVYYDEIGVNGYYGTQRFGSGKILPFCQGHKNTTVIVTKLDGQNLLMLSDGARGDLEEDLKSGIYRIHVKLLLKVRFKFGFIKSWKFKPKIRCDLKIPLGASNLTSGFQFQPTKCDFDLS